jgi:hypothetical protein
VTLFEADDLEAGLCEVFRGDRPRWSGTNNKNIGGLIAPDAR